MPSPPNVLAGPLQSEVDRLLLIEDYGTAARLLRDAGELGRACELFERIWEYREAASCALALGDLPRALEAHLAGGDLVAAAQITTRLRDAPPAEQLRAAALLERRRRFEAAASLYESAGELGQSATLYRRAGEPLQAARLWEQQGRLREAITDYERAIADAVAAAVPVAPGRTVAPSPEAGRAELGLGRTLRSFGRAIEAVLPLQAAARAPDPAVRRAGRWLLVRALAEMQLRAGAREALRMLRADLTSEPVEPPAFREHDLEAFLRLPLPALAAPSGAATAGTVAVEGGTAAEGSASAAPLLAGRYRLERLLGAGSTGRVYRAHDLLAERPVALKLLTPPEPSRARDRYQRFVREARVIAGLRHPNIVPILDANEELGLLAMELMEGGTLASRLGQKLDPHVVTGVVQGMAAALQVAHQRGIVHRDLKPENVFVGGAGDVKLGDFGVAHLIDLGETQTAGFIGSLAYMSPEQITAAPVSAATDLYALGVTVFQLLTGRLPFQGPDFVSEHLGATPPSATELCPGLDPAWDPLLGRLLAKRPQDRFASTEELLLALAPIAERARAEARLRAPGTPIGGLTFPEPASSLSAADPTRVAATAAPAGTGIQRWLERYGEPRPAGPLSAAAEQAGLQLWQGIDPGLGCPVRLEVWPAGFATGAEGRVHLERLRATAGQTLPGTELILALEHDDSGTLVVFEELETAAVAVDPTRALPPDEALERVLAALVPLHAAGLAHGLIDADSLALTVDGPVLRFAGRLPARLGTPADDLRDLAEAWRARGLPVAPLGALRSAASAGEALERLLGQRAAAPADRSP